MSTTYRTLIELPRNSFISGSLLAAYDRRQQAPTDRKPYGARHGHPPGERIHSWPGDLRLAKFL